MAFELPSVPNFNVQPVQAPDLLGQAGKMLQLKQLMGEQQLLPLQVQEQQERVKQMQTQNKVADLQLQAQQGRADFWANPDKYLPADGEEPDHPKLKADPLAGFLGIQPDDPLVRQIHGMIKAGMPGPAAIADAQQSLEFRKNVATMTQEQQKVLGTALTNLKSIAAPILAEKDANKKQSLINDALPGLGEWAKFDPLLSKIVPSLNAGNFDAFANRLGAESEGLGIVKAAADATTAQQKIVDPKTGMSPEQQGEANKEIAVQTNPQVQAGKVAVSKAEATAREQVQLQMEPIRLQIQQQFQNQKDARDKIETNVLKPFQDKMTDVTMARSAISQAETNPVAARAAIFKMVGVAQPTGSHRVLPMEFTAFKYPGGITDQVKEKFNDFLSGKPWTPEIAQAANSFIDGQAQAAQTSLSSGIDNTNKLFGTTVGTGLKQDQPTAPPNFFSKFGGRPK